MVIIGRSQIAGGGTAKRLEFEYTGTYNERLDDGVVELLTSGVLTVTKDTAIDAFLVGGGASGSGGSNAFNSLWNGGGGGGGGFTKTITNALLQANVGYSIVIGAGGIALAGKEAYGKKGSAGGETTAFGYTVKGGSPSANSELNGGNGGSGGGVGGGRNTSIGVTPGDGASDGNDALTINSRVGGTGQGTTTREFGETTGKLYAGGGAGAKSSESTTTASGGEGGGGNQSASGEANTGGGGGGGTVYTISNEYASSPGSGGSGIVCIRLHKE
nr:MAG TPA: hypothetical protein [Caudoviricetes sp.]